MTRQKNVMKGWQKERLTDKGYPIWSPPQAENGNGGGIEHRSVLGWGE